MGEDSALIASGGAVCERLSAGWRHLRARQIARQEGAQTQLRRTEIRTALFVGGPVHRARGGRGRRRWHTAAQPVASEAGSRAGAQHAHSAWCTRRSGRYGDQWLWEPAATRAASRLEPGTGAWGWTLRADGTSRERRVFLHVGHGRTRPGVDCFARAERAVAGRVALSSHRRWGYQRCSMG